MIDNRAERLLKNVVREAIYYVGRHNSGEREKHALLEVERCFEAAKLNKYEEIEFRDD